MMMMTDPIRILFSSDHHFGAPSINQEEMAIAFANTIFPLLEETDIFFINGDFFDTLVIFDNHGFDPIYDTILNLFYLCNKLNVKLRILQGTFTHDRKQLKRFETFYRNNRFTFDFKYVEMVELEEISFGDRSLRFLYVQDDLPCKTSDDALIMIDQKMQERGWDYVDYACMHGFFDFTFPKGVSQDNVVVFKSEQFSFVKKIIDVGHVHQHRIQDSDVDKNYPTVISNGSFDRLNQGDEDPKGLIKVLDYPDHYTAQFVENKEAAIYHTIYFDKDDTTETITKAVSDYLISITTNRTISLRFQTELLEHREAIKQWMKEVHPDIKISWKKNGDKSDEPTIFPSSALLIPVEKRIAPTPATIATFILSNISGDHDLTTEKIDAYLTSP